MPTEAELWALLTEVDGLPRGSAQVSALERVIRHADARGLVGLGVRARLRAVTAYLVTSQANQALAAFLWCLHAHDEPDGGKEKPEAHCRAQRQDREIGEHVHPQVHQLVQRVPRAPLLPLVMLDFHPPDPVGRPQDQAVDVRKRQVVLDDLLHQERIEQLETRQVQVARLAQHDVRHLVVEPAAKVPPPRMPLRKSSGSLPFRTTAGSYRKPRLMRHSARRRSSSTWPSRPGSSTTSAPTCGPS